MMAVHEEYLFFFPSIESYEQPLLPAWGRPDE